MKKINLSEWALRHQPLVLYFMVMLMVSGLWAYTQLGQKEDPEFTFKAMLVQTYWPGASAEEVEQQISDRQEEKLQELNGIKTLISYNYYKEDEFWQIFNRKNYDAVKTVTDPDNIFRNLYEKTCRASMGQES